MQILFRELIEKDELFLNDVLEKSFNFDSEVAFGKSIRLGPPGYDNGTLSKKIINSDSFTTLIIIADQEECGVLVYTIGTPNIVNYFCLDPVFIGKGIGSLAWRKLEQEKKGIWQLDTPAFSLRNHFFYEKNGFEKIGEKTYESNAVSFIYRKIIKDV